MKTNLLNTKLIVYLFLISCSLLLHGCAAHHISALEEQAEGISSADIINDEDLKRVEQIKLKSTGIVKRAFEVEENHRKLTLQETSDLLAILNDRFKKSGLSVGDFEDQVLKRIHRDLEIINAFNKMLESSKTEEKDFSIKLCKQNELLEIISAGEEIVQEHIEDMVNGILPEEFKKSLSQITTLERNKQNEIISGSFKPTSFKGAIITMLVTLQGEHANSSTLKLPKKGNRNWLDYSTVFHTIPMPKKINVSSPHPDFKSFTYYYKDATSPSQGELVFPHSGYFPDGNNVRNPNKGISNPEDCSSWVFHQILKAQYPITSFDVTQFFRRQTGLGLYDKNYSKTREYYWLNSAFIPLSTKNFQSAIKPGFLLCIRRPDAEGVVIPSKNYGASGHVAIALFATDTHIFALACTRDVPLMEGVGIQKLSLKREKNSDIMILRHK
jgi:hypothetical protein